ncbi:guanine permease [Moraxella osloensis]|uniref:Permease yicO n=1 Tax=Faucicola osloensis TaxID=34062 RepID=A0A378Q985_FAUOS|nr:MULTISPECIES: NCS2 family permease [Moraxella]AME00743.1 guanine permease [Moraxella osloensis]MCK6159126.1 NCS2 family permease [Moraxella osloensis]OBX54655.1 guanine permease [Moraxella osloensis]QPT41663.1 NCS2 family permease [Moraxella osloensis]WNP28331.1 NCS2 family permease [Moraxella sp. DOX410]
MNVIERYFGIDGRNTTIKTEILAGLTTFLTMAYIIFVNPDMLAKTGMDKGAVFVATCLASALGCFLMGLIARLPVALAPGMGLNAFFTFTVVLGMGKSWQVALGAVFISGLLFVLISAFKLREWIINAIPYTLKQGIVAGIGAFLAFIALKSSGIIVASPATFVTMGKLTDFGPAMAILSFFLIVVFVQRKVPAAVMLSILIVTVISLLAGETHYSGIVSMPPSIAPTFMQLDIAGALDVSMVSVIFAFLFVVLFDTSGTLIGVTKKAGLMSTDGQIPNLGKALFADSTAAVAGSLLGTSSVTSYVESTAGVAAGGRTGLTAIVVGVLFLLALFFAPLAGMIPAYATAGAIFYVAVLMLFTLREIDWDDLTEASPVAVVLLLTPLTFSIADGIALGFITYTIAKLVSGRYKEVSPAVWVLTAILLAKLIFLS